MLRMTKLVSETPPFWCAENIGGSILQSKRLVITFPIWAYDITNITAMYRHFCFLKAPLKQYIQNI